MIQNEPKGIVQAFMGTKICHLTSVHPIDDGRIFMKECSSLAASGFDVTLIACGDTAFEDIKNGVKRINICIPYKNRLQRIEKRPKAVYRRALLVNADIYHFHDPELMHIGLMLKKRNKIVICDVHEDYPCNIQTKDWIPKRLRNLIAGAMSFYEQRMAVYYDAIISVTPQIVKRFEKINENSFLITNYPIINNESNLKSKQKVNNTFCYAGTIEPLRMIHLIIQALEAIPDARFYLAGRIESGYLERLKKLPGSRNVIFLGHIPHQQVLSLYSRSIFGIVIENYHPTNYYNEGSLGVIKLFEFMEAGLPVICSDFVLHKKIIDNYKCGITVNPTNINDIVKAVKNLLNNPDKAKEMGKNGQRAIIQEYNWSTQEKLLLALYKKLSTR
jgi:glycosyltransferase involved in cell wall biosynthesis